MGKKGAKKDPNAPTLIPEDCFSRGKKLIEQKVAVKPPKGELTCEEWCIPPAFHSLPEFKHVIHYWKQCATVAYAERVEMKEKAPTRSKMLSNDNPAMRTHPRKEIQDMLKFLKSLCKQANKRTAQFLKNLEKKEGKETKREGLNRQYEDVENQMNMELRHARKFGDDQGIFDKKYMLGSKLGDVAPRQRALIVVECSDRQQQWVEEAKEEVRKLLYETIQKQEDTTTLNIATFSATGCNTWLPQYQPKDDPKKGIDDAFKWLNKNFSAKTCGAQAFPPDWLGMLNKIHGEGVPSPWRIFLCCSRMPENFQDVLDHINEIRQGDGPAKNEPVFPINCVAFDPQIVGDADEEAFFKGVAGPSGSFMIDTTQEDLLNLDKMLKAVAVKGKQLAKIDKKRQKMEDLSERVAADRELFRVQVALQNMLVNDYEICDWALKNETPVSAPEI